MPKRKAVQPTSYQSRAELQAMVAKLNKTLERQRRALQVAQTPAPVETRRQLATANRRAADPIEDEDDDSLPEIEAPIVMRPPQTADPIARAIAKQSAAGGIVIHPTPYVRSLFAKRRRGLGGFQSLHSAIANKIAGSKELRLTPADFARVVNYATNYGEGGFQQSLRWLVALYAAETIAPMIAARA